MPRRRNLTRLSAGEMELLRMLWERGPLTLARAHQMFADFGTAIAYPTMQTRLNRLAAKGFVARNQRVRPNIARFCPPNNRRPACSANSSISL